MSLAKFLAKAGLNTAKYEGLDPIGAVKEKTTDLWDDALSDKPKKKPKKKVKK